MSRQQFAILYQYVLDFLLLLEHFYPDTSYLVPTSRDILDLLIDQHFLKRHS